ncbi:MAG: glycosyltransferase, partial [Bacillota bacterium]
MAEKQRYGGKRPENGKPVAAAKRDVVAVVVSCNRKSQLLSCLERIGGQQGAACDILVIDNASADGTEGAVRALENEHIRYHNTGKNLGGAGGFNVGMRMAAGMGYRVLWLMDDDTLPEPDALSMLLEADQAAPAGYGFLSSVALWTDGTECRMNRQKLRKVSDTDFPLLRFGMVRAKQASFVSLFVRAQTVYAVGLPIAEFFIWGDDVEYTRRIAVRHRLPSYVAGKSAVVHAMPHNLGSSISMDAPQRIGRYRYAYRNENFTYRQEGVRGFAYYSAKCAINLWRVIWKAKGKKLRRAGIIIGQYFAGLFFNP